MYSHGYNWREEPEGTSISSLVLLLVFVGAAAFLAGMMYFRPWDDSPTPLPAAQVPSAEAPAVDAAAPPADAAPPAQ
jgi:Tfp pilus assembly protein PilN